MGKVICFFTREEITELPSNVEEGEALIAHLLSFELERAKNVFTPPVELISSLIAIVENNTGASRYSVMEKIYAKKV